MKPGKGAVFFIAVLLLVSTILASGCTDSGSEGGDSREVKSGDTVQVDYTGKLENGTVFDTSREDVAKQEGMYVEGREYAPLTFVAGSGQVIQGFDKGVIGMKVGEEKTIEIPPEEAYGEYNEAGILVIPIEELNITNQGFACKRVVSINSDMGIIYSRYFERSSVHICESLPCLRKFGAICNI